MAGPLKVIVVDDSHDAADMLAVLLKIYGHDVRTVYDGPQRISDCPRVPSARDAT